MAKLKGLGRGLDALLLGSDETTASDALKSLSIDRIRSGRYQPRTRMDEASLAELAESIRARGVIQPIVVRPVKDGEYEILAGERRWRAAVLAHLERIPAVVREVSDEESLHPHASGDHEGEAPGTALRRHLVVLRDLAADGNPRAQGEASVHGR